MLAKAPEDRPQSMLEVLNRLEAWRSSTAASKSLRVFNDPRASKGETRDQPRVEPKPEDRETYDLMTYVRSELFDPEATLEAPSPIPPRKSKKAGSLRRKADLALRCLVAAAAVVVLIRFFPKISLDTPAISTPVQPASKPPEPPVIVEVVPPKVEAPTPKPTPTPAPETKPADPTPPVSPSDRTGPSLLDRLLGPPPPYPPPPGAWPPPPRPGEKRPPRPGDGRPPRRPGEGRPPRQGDGPPSPTPPAGGTIPF